VKESLPITLITESSDRRFILVDKSTTADVYEVIVCFFSYYNLLL